MTRETMTISGWAAIETPSQGQVHIADASAAQALIELAKRPANAHQTKHQDSKAPEVRQPDVDVPATSADGSEEQDAELQQELGELAARVKCATAEERAAAQRARALQEQRQNDDELRRRHKVCCCNSRA